jgi:hypothetical protein
MTITPGRERRRRNRIPIHRERVADGDERQAQVFRNRAAGRLHLVDQHRVDARAPDGVGRVAAERGARPGDRPNREPERLETFQAAELCQRLGK